MARTAASPAATSSAFMRNTENATSSGMVSRTISAPTMTPLKSTGIRNDRNGKPFKLTAEGFKARAICHEIDHLDGILYIDRIKK